MSKLSQFVPGAFLKRISAGVLFTALLALPATSASSPVCAARADLLKQLSTRFKEEPVALGLTNNGSLVELLTSEKGSTWTIMISQPNGASCLVAAGEGWEELKRVASGERGA